MSYEMRAHTRRSNFRPSMSIGDSMYFWITNFREAFFTCCYFGFRNLFGEVCWIWKFWFR